MYVKVFKRLFDTLFSLIGIVFSIPVFLIVAPIIWLEDRGSVFYNANRLGKKGIVFKMYKFRTMKVNAPDIRNKDGSTYNGDDDPRLTKIGKLLRKTSLDELPQLLNVLKGDMSFIGPRPDLPEHIKEYSKYEKKKLDVLPGITGYNQAYYRNSIEWHERLKKDVFYVENISFILDIKIFFKTIITIIKKEGVFVNNGKYTIKELEWDTNYFGVKSAKVVLNDTINEKDIKNIKKEIKKYQFITIQNSNNNNENNKVLGSLNCFLVDVNVQFEKKLDNKRTIVDRNIIIENNCKEKKELLLIAKDAYVYSRFINDKNLEFNKSKLLYYNWLKNSFNKNDKYISYYKEKNKYLGYCLFHIENSSECVIELIATDNNIQGKGIGTKLLESVDNYCLKNNIKTIKVGTQLDNIKAQNFYIKNKYIISCYNSIYHIWS